MLRAASVVPCLFACLSGAAAAQTPVTTLGDAIGLAETRRPLEARPLLLALAAREPRNHAAAYWAGRVLVELGEQDAAAKHLERAIHQQPDNAEYLLWLGRAYGLQAQRASPLRQPGLARRTKHTFERVVALDPDNLDARSHLIDFHLAAPGIMGGSRQTALQQAHEIHARNAWRGLQELARVQADMGQHTTAEQTLQTLVQTYPDSSGSHIALAVFLQNTKRWDEALHVLQARATMTPPDRPALYQIGRLAAVSGTYLGEGERALREYVNVLPARTEPSLAAAHWRLGAVLEQRGDRTGARRAYEEAVRLEPGHEQARQALRNLRE